MLTLRKSASRGQANHGWLKSFHSFSFADYQDENHKGFGPIKVINEDIIAAGKGFATHGHSNMEIITIVTVGAIDHKDTLGNSCVINPGEIQRMSAGTGIRHSEVNHYKDRSTQLFQIWISPNKIDTLPSYAQKDYMPSLRRNQLLLVASEKETATSISLQQDVDIWLGRLDASKGVEHQIASGRKVWLQSISGHLNIYGKSVKGSDAMAVEDEPSLYIRAEEDSEFLIFDVSVKD